MQAQEADASMYIFINESPALTYSSDPSFKRLSSLRVQGSFRVDTLYIDSPGCQEMGWEAMQESSSRNPRS